MYFRIGNSIGWREVGTGIPDEMRLFTIALYGAVAMLSGCAQPIPSAPATRQSVSAHGEATIALKPDRVSFSAGVETRDASAAEAFRKNNAKVNAILAALKDGGVTEQQIQTSYLDISTVPAHRNTPAHFKVSNLVTVTREDPTEVGNLIQAVVRAGANDVGSLRFFVADSLAIEQRGLEQAFENARSKAEALAKRAGMTVGNVLSVSDNAAYAEGDVGHRLSSIGYVGNSSIQPGIEKQRFTVSVVFELK